jgi:hypothetical protein
MAKRESRNFLGERMMKKKALSTILSSKIGTVNLVVNSDASSSYRSSEWLTPAEVEQFPQGKTWLKKFQSEPITEEGEECFDPNYATVDR